jgi:hypothetical protein
MKSEGLQINFQERTNGDGWFHMKYCLIDLSKSAFQMMDSALTAGAAVTATTTVTSWKGTCNQSKENQEEQQQGSEYDSQAAILATIMATPVHTPTSVTPLNVATTFTNVDAASGQDNLKTCKECSQPKPQTEFTASQWKNRVGTGSCITCVSKCIQWKVYNIGSAFQTKVCSECKRKKSHLAFTPNQWRKLDSAKNVFIKALPIVTRT